MAKMQLNEYYILATFIRGELMFLISSLLASSLDGFISGFILKTTGMTFKNQDYVKIFLTISICCLFSSDIGNIFSQSNISSYMNIFGAIIMLYLAFASFSSIEKEKNFTNPFAVAISLSADASVVCMYLGMSGYNIFKVSIMSGIMHTVLMMFGAFLSNSLIGDRFSKLAKFLAGLIFLAMSIAKIKSI